MRREKVDLSVVVAAYNEETIIRQSIQQIIDELSVRPDVKWELICVNDGSKDLTGEYLEEIADCAPQLHIYHHWRNFGQGRALRTAFSKCNGSTIVTLDADLSYGPHYIYLLSDTLIESKADISLASPFSDGGEVNNVPFHRHFLSRWGNRYLAKMSHYDISTSTCVVRAYRKEVIDNLYLSSDGMELQLEILMKAAMLGYKVCEVPAELVWNSVKMEENKTKRVSKMKLLQTMRLSLLMGWLSRPAYLFIVPSILFLLIGGYMMAFLLFRVFSATWRLIDKGFIVALSEGLREIFSVYTYSFAVSGVLLLFGFQVLASAFLFIQNKFYFEELYRITQSIEVEKIKIRGGSDGRQREE